MKNKFKLLLSIFLLGTTIGLTSCNNNNNNKVDPLDPNTRELIKLNDPNDLLPETPYTDACKLNADYEGKVFTADGIGLVHLASNTDGDTAKFYDYSSASETRFPLRFLGIDTPESTANIEPWGKKASVFVAKILTEAETNGDILLINDYDVFGRNETNGRFLGFVWYRLDKTSDFRLLNLEIVEQGYSKNLLFDKSKVCDYLDYFQKADTYAARMKLRVQGTKDPGYDYSNTVIKTTIKYLIDNYEELGVTENSSGKMVKIDACVIGIAGDSLYVRDVVPNENGELGYTYLFSGYGKSVASVVKPSDFISFYCKATKFLENIQLSDLKFDSYGKYAFTNYSRIAAQDVTDPSLTEADIKEINEAKEMIATFTPFVESDFNSLDDCKTLSDVAQFSDRLVTARLTIRTVNASSDDDQNEGTSSGDYYYKKDANKNMTIYSYLNDESSRLYINMRVDGNCYPYPGETLFEVGKTYIVKGYLKPYYEKYQVCLFNNNLEYNYITEVK
ncbi:MAG: thermonuclease family protein [Mollicutes bacterium]|nr:thermonuclease family protein [Mollicutes bacterium]MDD7264427.1 thermonuclease family protein [bacterium]MDY4979371.1 thermonuclease family protein [Candidatus Onthovivens sp.]